MVIQFVICKREGHLRLESSYFAFVAAPCDLGMEIRIKKIFYAQNVMISNATSCY